MKWNCCIHKVVDLKDLSCCNLFSGGDCWRGNTAGVAVSLLEPAGSEGGQQGDPGGQLQAARQDSGRVSPRRRALPHVCAGRWASGPKPHEVQPVEQGGAQGILLIWGRERIGFRIQGKNRIRQRETSSAVTICCCSITLWFFVFSIYKPK